MKRSRIERAAAISAKRPPTARHDDLDVVVTRRPATWDRRRRIVRLLAILLDTSAAPGDGHRS